MLAQPARLPHALEMIEVWDWITGHAIEIVGGIMLILIAAAIYVVVAKTDKHRKVQTDSNDPSGE